MRTISDYQTAIGAWHRDRWGDPGPVMLGLKLAEEVGEVAEAVVKVEQGHPRADEMNLPDELADVLIVALAMADLCGVDLSAALAAKVARIGVEPCTGLSAAWCHLHGDCTCENREEHMADDGCPLHDTASSHAAVSEGALP